MDGEKQYQIIDSLANEIIMDYIDYIVGERNTNPIDELIIKYKVNI